MEKASGALQLGARALISSPKQTGVEDYLGAFAVTAGVRHRAAAGHKFENDNDDYNAIMTKASPTAWRKRWQS